MRTLYTDIDDFACAILEARVADGSLPPGDVVRADISALVSGKRMRAWLRRYTHVHLFCGLGGSPLGLAWAGWPAEWSIVTGGFPCQDISSAGKGKGLDGARSGLYREMLRAARLIRPLGLFGENVGALSARGLDRLASEMGAMGYRPHALRLGAWAVGSPQERERWWILANAERGGRAPGTGEQGHEEEARRGRDQSSSSRGVGQLADAAGCGRRGGVARRGESGRASTGWAGEGSGVGDAMRDRRQIENAHPGQRQGRVATPGPGQSCICGFGDFWYYKAPEEHRRDCPVVKPAGEGHQVGDREQGQQPPTLRAGDPCRWPHPLWVDDAGNPVPTPQYDWEPPRLFPGTNTINAQWRLALMGYPLHWLDLPAKVAARFGTDRARNKRGIEATGNAQVPQCVKLIAAAWVEAMKKESAA